MVAKSSRLLTNHVATPGRSDSDKLELPPATATSTCTSGRSAKLYKTAWPFKMGMNFSCKEGGTMVMHRLKGTGRLARGSRRLEVLEIRRLEWEE